MKLTVDYLLNLLDEVTKNVEFDYVKPGSSKVKLLSVNYSSKTVSLQRVTGLNYENANISKDTLSILANSISENTPFSIESVLKGSGNKRSVYEAILARTSDFYKCTVGRIKHLVWVPSQRHQVDKLVVISLDELQKISGMIQVNTQLMELEKYRPYITAIKSKPFLLLAGISGTGKSRIVREFAFKSCPKYLQDKEGTTPGNYCMIEVKPNWHDSTELLGYYSNLSGSYQFKKFVKFLVKAMMFPDVPFFVCLDEMNLAPVEQYFAEILSILETRKHPKGSNGEIDMSTIQTEGIIDARYFQELSRIKSAINQETGAAYDNKLTDKQIYMKLFGIDSEENIDDEIGNRKDLTTRGLTLPDNVIIIGTVNMDDTTHQFSRKVIDRAMTIEMNGGKLIDMFGGSKDLEYIEDEEEQKKWQHSFSPRYVTADEVLETHSEQAEDIKRILPQRLESINMALKGTPFEVSYRVLNELTIMVGVMLDDKKEGDSLDNIINQAVNNILLMKILPRIEGDAEMFALSKAYKDKLGITYNDRLEWLKALAPDIVQAEETNDESREDNAGAENGSEEKPEDKHAHYQTAKDKIQEMIDRLNNQDFTRFWP